MVLAITRAPVFTVAQWEVGSLVLIPTNTFLYKTSRQKIIFGELFVDNDDQ